MCVRLGCFAPVLAFWILARQGLSGRIRDGNREWTIAKVLVNGLADLHSALKSAWLD